jgi:hypothetical protein
MGYWRRYEVTGYLGGYPWCEGSLQEVPEGEACPLCGRRFPKARAVERANGERTCRLPTHKAAGWDTLTPK